MPTPPRLPEQLLLPPGEVDYQKPRALEADKYQRLPQLLPWLDYQQTSATPNADDFTNVARVRLDEQRRMGTTEEDEREDVDNVSHLAAASGEGNESSMEELMVYLQNVFHTAPGPEREESLIASRDSLMEWQASAGRVSTDTVSEYVLADAQGIGGFPRTPVLDGKFLPTFRSQHKFPDHYELQLEYLAHLPSRHLYLGVTHSIYVLAPWFFGYNSRRLGNFRIDGIHHRIDGYAICITSQVLDPNNPGAAAFPRYLAIPNQFLERSLREKGETKREDQNWRMVPKEFNPSLDLQAERGRGTWWTPATNALYQMRACYEF